MDTVTCTLCHEENASIVCNDCKTLVCKNCSAKCKECRVAICTTHTLQTKSGTKLCGGCMGEREARRQALREKYNKPSTPSPVIQSTSFSALDDSPATLSPAPEVRDQSTSLEDLTEGEQLIRPAVELEEYDEEAELDRHYEEKDDRVPEQEHMTAYFTETGRLELPPMDQNRPVLGASGYRPPSKTTMLIVLVFFGLAMAFTVRVVPALNDTLFPFSGHETKFDAGLMPIISDTNALRNAGNIRGLDIMAQSATFFIAWTFLITYVGGILLLLFAFIHSLIWSRQAKSQQEAMKSLDQNSKDLYM